MKVTGVLGSFEIVSDAIQELGKNMPRTAFLGATFKIFGEASLPPKTPLD